MADYYGGANTGSQQDQANQAAKSAGQQLIDDTNNGNWNNWGKDLNDIRFKYGQSNNLAPQYGGSTTGALDAAQHYSQTGQDFYNRGTQQINQGAIGIDRGFYDQDQGQRAQELSALYARATGQAGPSAAQNAAVTGAQNAAAGNVSLAHGMGGAGGALAARNAATQAAALQTGGANQAAQIGAQEQAQAAQQYMAASNRGFDLQNQSAEQGLAGAQGQLDAQGLSENDRMLLGYQDLGQKALGAQLASDSSGYGERIQGQGAIQRAKDASDAQTRDAVIGGVTTMGGAALLSDIRAKGDIQPQGSGPMQGNGGYGGYGRPPLSQVMGGGGGMQPGGFRPQISTPVRPPMGGGPPPGGFRPPVRPPMGGASQMPGPGGFRPQVSTPVAPPPAPPSPGGFQPQMSTPVRPPMGGMMSDARAKADAMAQGVRAGLHAGMSAPRTPSPHDMALLDTRVTDTPERRARLAQEAAMEAHLRNLRESPDMISGSSQIPPSQIPGALPAGVMSDERAKTVSSGLERSPPSMGQGMSLGRTLLSGPADPNRSYPGHEAYAFRDEYMPPGSIMSDERTKDVKPKHMVEDSDRRNLLINNEGGSREVSYPGRTRRLERLTREDPSGELTWTRPEPTPGNYSFASDERVKFVEHQSEGEPVKAHTTKEAPTATASSVKERAAKHHEEFPNESPQLAGGRGFRNDGDPIQYYNDAHNHYYHDESYNPGYFKERHDQRAEYEKGDKVVKTKDVHPWGAGDYRSDRNPHNRPYPLSYRDLHPELDVSSDERVKSGGGHDMTEADHFLNHLHPYTYRYKDPSYEPSSQPNGGHYLGVMAQDVERAPVVGRQIVKDTPRGKMLEGGALMSALAAGVGRLHERVAQLEGGNGNKGSRGHSAKPKDER